MVTYSFDSVGWIAAGMPVIINLEDAEEVDGENERLVAVQLQMIAPII